MKSKQFFSKTICFLACLSLLFALTSCKRNRKYDEQEVRENAVVLIGRSVLLNEIYYGAGIPYDTDLSVSNGIYKKALDDYMNRQPFGTLDELRALTRTVYSSGMCDLIFSTRLSSVADEDGIRSMARYYQKYEGDLSKTPEYIMVNTESENLLPDLVEYRYDTLKVLYSKGEKVYVSIGALVTAESGETQERTLKIALLEEEDGWRLDSPTYLKYSGEIEEYEKLK